MKLFRIVLSSWFTSLSMLMCLNSLSSVQCVFAQNLTANDNRLSQFGVVTLEYIAPPNNVLRVTALTPANGSVPSLAAFAGLQLNQEIVEINGVGWGNQSQAIAALTRADASGRIVLKLTNNTSISLVTTNEQDRIFKSLGFNVADAGGGTGDILIQATTGHALQAGLRQNDKILLLDGDVFRPAAIFKHVLALHFLNRTEVTLKIESAAGERFVATLPPTTSAKARETPLLTRGLQSRDQGPHIPYPPFLGAKKEATFAGQDRAELKANEIVTARVELYYFRDAHRVAEILNRQAKSYNGAAVTQFERAAETAREEFEEKRLKRREAEETARQIAIELQNQESELVHRTTELRKQIEGDQQRSASATQQRKQYDDAIQRTQKQQVEVNAELDKVRDQLTFTPNDAGLQNRRGELERLLNLLRTNETQLTNDRSAFNANQIKLDEDAKVQQKALRDSVEASLKLVKESRLKEMQESAKADRANDLEERAAKEQFRREVSAAKVDPDTYVPGDINSIDPVSQVSISVIGEGVLHLRGPRKGVNKIRYMIDQLDHPVGQVKVGVMTVQLNGENGPRMENTMRRVEGNISRARFLAYVSSQLFARAVIETANKVAVEAGCTPLNSYRAAQAKPDGFEEEERWKRYLETFFGEDFLAEIRDVDETMQLLNPEHKLLALNSMDSITLGEALFLTGICKHSIREQILMKLEQFLSCELPEKEVQWIITNKLYCHKDPRWWGDAKYGRLKTYENANLRYRFTAIRTYFERMYEHGELSSNILNPLQRDVIKLAQGISLEQALNIQRQAMIEKRALVKEAAITNENCQRGSERAISHMDLYFLDQQIDELEEKHLNAVESLRGRKAAIDKLVKSVVIAVEDDVTAQFYDPALERIRRASWEWDVELASIERTTILTNNRAFGKVAPQATYEFDLPRRDIALAEALKAASALQKDVGPLLGDPGFAALAMGQGGASLRGGAGTVKNILPGLPSGTDQQDLLFGDSAARKYSGLELEKLVPDPAIYKLETGTGYEVRPVVQPDGQSVQFDFNYMYTTDLLEPVRANEKHLGRIKRHFINTEVQLGNLEWREISRYEVALKAERNARGVPLLEDIPVVGLLARPLPQAQKSLQKNIIIGQAAIYPTIEDLLSLKPANLCHMDIGQTLCDAEHENMDVARRLRDINQRLSNQVDCMLDSRGQAPIPNCKHGSECDYPMLPENGPIDMTPGHRDGPHCPPEPMGARNLKIPGNTTMQRPTPQTTRPVSRSTPAGQSRVTSTPPTRSIPRERSAPISPDVSSPMPARKTPPAPPRIPTQGIQTISHEVPAMRATEPQNLSPSNSGPAGPAPHPVTSAGRSSPNVVRNLLRKSSASKAATSFPETRSPRRVK